MRERQVDEEATLERVRQSLSVDAVRLVVTRPPLPISSEQIVDLSKRLVSKFQTLTQDSEDVWTFSTSGRSAFVIVTKDRVQFSIEERMDEEIIKSTIGSALSTVLDALHGSPPYPYAIYTQGSFDADASSSLLALQNRVPAFQECIPEKSTGTMGGGLRLVFRIGEQVHDCKVETFFTNPKKFWVSVDANSLSMPAENAEALAEALTEKYDFFVNTFVPHVVGVFAFRG